MAKVKSGLPFPIRCRLRDRKSGEAAAAIVRPMKRSDLLLWAEWRYTAGDEDRDWDWAVFLADSRKPNASSECYALVSESGLEGLMCIDIQAEPTDEGKALVIVYLSSNPRNRGTAGRLKDIGKGLIAVAILRSVEIGTGGRLWLESLPGAVGAYLTIGFADSGRISVDNLPIYVLGSDGAARIMLAIEAAGILALPDEIWQQFKR